MEGLQGLKAGVDAEAYKQLLRFGRGLTQRAREGKVHPAIGRDEEIGGRGTDAGAGHQAQPGAARGGEGGQDGHCRGPGLPVSELSREQRRRLLKMPAMLARRVLGQGEAVPAVPREMYLT